MSKTIFSMMAAALVIVCGGVPAAARQTQPQAKPAAPQLAPMSGELIRDNLYFVKGGSGAHTAFYVTQKFVIAVDAKMTADAGRDMIAEIAKVTPNPLSILIISHSDGDHINGLPGFPAGLTILASQATANEMEEAFKDEKMIGHRAYLPTKAYEGSSEIRGLLPDGKMYLVSLYQYGPAHTSGDTVILFHNARAAFIGDLAFVGRDPLIHRQKGGTSFGYIESLKMLIALPAETYLSGHADPLTKDDLKVLLASLEEKMAKVKALLGQGKTLEEIKAALGVQPSAASRWPSLVEIMVLDLTEKKF